MKQRVKNISYLSCVIFALKDVQGKTDITNLPTGAEVLHISLEVLEPNTQGITLDIGLDEQGEFFGNDIPLATKGSTLSNVICATNKLSQVNFTPSASASDGVVKFRVEYFLPSEIVTEL